MSSTSVRVSTVTKNYLAQFKGVRQMETCEEYSYDKLIIEMVRKELKSRGIVELEA